MVFPFPKFFPKIIEMFGLFQYFKIFKLTIGKNVGTKTLKWV